MAVLAINIMAQPNDGSNSIHTVIRGVYNPYYTQGGNPTWEKLNKLADTTRTTSFETSKHYNDRIEPENPIVHDAALRFASTADGALNINQIRFIYEYLRYGDDLTKGWIYKYDPRTSDYLAYANETLRIGKEIGCTGTGDCDDFALLMSALIESIGGSTRIIHACNNDSCHAYSEVYLGKSESLTDSDSVAAIIKSLMYTYGKENIYVHADDDPDNIYGRRGDVWLNLDWWSNYPGGEFFESDSSDSSVIVWTDLLATNNPVSIGIDENPRMREKGFELIQEGKYNEALAAYDEAIKYFPNDALSYYSKGVIYCKLGMTGAAESAYKKAGELDSSYSDYHC